MISGGEGVAARIKGRETEEVEEEEQGPGKLFPPEISFRALLGTLQTLRKTTCSVQKEGLFPFQSMQKLDGNKPPPR